ncbi:uncharacterized protein BP5553_07769 [Venustampulla echinocandica]|uniref:Uncharacterized protein n=1 Tax=Venustampulla echinocandica TaxID=2656787 RepID=A0A370THG3_9HELO|nr:uncharacterized protein BP5553_07769 [Venustampulla echinocandica]RDL34641.1 hypothetical protein BP5553_07769 [Venustampulla echinocandica]
MPYQYIKKCGNLLAAARGSNIDIFNSADGSLCSTWSSAPAPAQVSQNASSIPEDTDANLAAQEPQPASVENEVNTTSPPAKRRKLSSTEDGKNIESKEDIKEPEKGGKNEKKQKQNKRPGSSSSGLEAPAVIALAVTKNAQHVVAITGEDKSIRVFEVIEKHGIPQLNHISQRAMPKRPSSLAITDDSWTIISADKFGDVYSLPLLPSEVTPQAQATRASSMASERPYKPAANELTIHSQRNRKALENQRRHGNAAPEKIAPTFECNLLLGHVSMLTDLLVVTLNDRNYIITADRDEHIRVSRGIPQAHIIENFCLGHKEFISRICIPNERPEVLISGGGDDYLSVWNWEAGKLLSQAPIKSYATDVLSERMNEADRTALKESQKVAVSGIFHTRQSSNGGFLDLILVACEAIPALFIFSLTANNVLEYTQTLKLQGNALSVATDLPTLEVGKRMLVSIDDIYEPGSATQLRPVGDNITNPLQAFVFENGVWVTDEGFKMALVKDDEALAGRDGNNSRLQNLLYSIENLRKRDGEERGGEAAGDDITQDAGQETGAVQDEDVQVTG